MTDEKFDEKEREKQEEKNREKGMEEKWRRDPLGVVVWGTILIWAGLVLLADNLGFLPVFPWFDYEGWSLIFLGAGLIILLEVFLRLLIPAYRRPVGGSLFLAMFLIGIGLSETFGWNIVWPIILITLGVIVLLRSLLRR